MRPVWKVNAKGGKELAFVTLTPRDSKVAVINGFVVVLFFVFCSLQHYFTLNVCHSLPNVDYKEDSKASARERRRACVFFNSSIFHMSSVDLIAFIRNVCCLLNPNYKFSHYCPLPLLVLLLVF